MQRTRAATLDEAPASTEPDPSRVASLKLNLLVGSAFFLFFVEKKKLLIVSYALTSNVFYELH